MSIYLITDRTGEYVSIEADSMEVDGPDVRFLKGDEVVGFVNSPISVRIA